MNGLTEKQVKKRFMISAVIGIAVWVMSLAIMPASDVPINAEYTIATAIVCVFCGAPTLAGVMMDWPNRSRSGVFFRMLNLARSLSYGAKLTIWTLKCMFLGYRGIVWALQQEAKD